MNKKNSEGLRILMAEGVSQPHTEATPGEILRCAQDDTGADNGTQPGTGATASEILRSAQDDKMADGVTQPGIGATEAADETTNRVDEEDTAKTAQQPTTTEDGLDSALYGDICPDARYGLKCRECTDPGLDESLLCRSVGADGSCSSDFRMLHSNYDSDALVVATRGHYLWLYLGYLHRHKSCRKFLST